MRRIRRCIKKGARGYITKDTKIFSKNCIKNAVKADLKTTYWQLGLFSEFTQTFG